MASTLERLQARFDADPDDSVAFAGLEEHLFLRGEWDELVALYERRLAAPALEAQPRERAQIHFRLGQVVEERRLEPERAAEAYRESARLDPQFRPALRQLRRLHMARGEWMLALQLAEVEGAAPMRPFERAAFHADLGTLWQRGVGDTLQALDHFDRALAIDPTHRDALAGRARALESLDRPQEAAAAWERLLGVLRGPEQIPALVGIARLLEGPLGDRERARDFYHRALAADPRNPEAVESLFQLASATEQWDLVLEVQEARFDLAVGATRRIAVALEAARVAVERSGDLEAATRWCERALDLGPDRPATHAAMAEIERRRGDRAALALRLDRMLELAGDAGPPEQLEEAARLHMELGDCAAAIPHLERLAQRDPDASAPLEALAAALEGAQRFEDLADVLERRAALAASPQERGALQLERGRLLEERLGDLDAAREAYERALDTQPHLAGAVEALERHYRKNEAWGELRTLLEAEAQAAQGGERVTLLCSLGELLADAVEAPDAAARAFEEALSLVPRSERALRGLASLALRSRDEEAVLRAYEREAAVCVDGERLAFLVGQLAPRLEELGRHEDALRWAQRLSAALPEDRAALEAVARLEEALGRDADLCRSLERLDALLPGCDQATNRRRLARANSRLGQSDAAQHAWRRALELEPSGLESLEALAALLEAAGEHAELALVERRLASRLPASRRAGCLDALARRLEGPLGDPHGAIRVLEELLDEPAAPADVEPRLTQLLERTGRHADLARRLAARAEREGGDAESRREAALRRAELLRGPLGRPEEAVAVFRAVLAADPGCEAALAGLEQVLRELGDAEALVELLARRAARGADTPEGARLALERAVLLDEVLGSSEPARAAYEALADSSPDGEVRGEAQRRLERMLERAGDFRALRERLAAQLGGEEPGTDFRLHLRLAQLCRDQLADRDGAIRHFEAAARLEPGRADLWQSLALLQQQADRPADLLCALEGELACGPEAERELTLRLRAAALCEGPLADAERAAGHYVRVLELAPGDAAAAEFLAARFERENRFAELAALLAARLAALAADPRADAAATLALRLQLAELRAGALGDLDAAIATLEEARAASGPIAALAEPLATLYTRAGRVTDLVGLCRDAAQGVAAPRERASWTLRLAAALQEAGDESAAAEAYRRVLEDRPGDRTAQAALREIHRRRGEPQPLARLLEIELERACGEAEAPLRLELAALLAGPLARPADALVQLRRVLELDPTQRDALERALAIQGALGREAEAVKWIDSVLPAQRERSLRAELLARRGALLQAQGRLEEAVAARAQALELQPGLREVRRELRRTLEALARWDEVLGHLAIEAHGEPPETRAELFELGARIAAERIAPEAALPWLERLREVRPRDPGVLARIAELHRRAGRAESLLRTLEAEAALGPEPVRLREIHAERARLLERELGSPARAVAALEAARALAPGDRRTLAELERLYARSGRIHEQAEALEALLSVCEANERAAFALRAGELWQQLGDLERAVRQLGGALAAGEVGAARIELLRALGAALRSSGRTEGWARCAEEELAALDAGAAVFRERRRTLVLELARAYTGELARPEAALTHLRALAGAGAEPDMDASERTRCEAEREWAETTLLALLRSRHDAVELAQRLARRLERRPGDVEGWLELARLHHERLFAPAAAADAYREVLLRAPDRAVALRGLRAVSEQLGDWEEVARVLERELALEPERPARERAALLRRLGEISWRELRATARASRAFAAAVEADPRDFASLRSLQELLEAMEDWRGALDLYASEIESLGKKSRRRRRELWLRIAALARTRLRDLARAAQAFEAADALAPLAAQPRAELAEIYREQGDVPRYAAALAALCDEPGAGAEEHLALARALCGLGRDDEALARLERAQSLEPRHAAVWEETARLREARGELEEAAEALARSADAVPDAEACVRLVRAAALVEADDPERAAERLEQALARDPGSAAAHAALARVAERLGRHQRAEQAAARALDLSVGAAALAPQERLDAALRGARAARAAGSLEGAARLHAQALALDPVHPEALEAQAEVLFALGDRVGARGAAEARLALAAEPASRARLLSICAAALAEVGQNEPALARFEEALAQDPALEAAHEGRVRLLEAAGRGADAAAALEVWAACAAPARRSECLVRAAVLEAERDPAAAKPEALLRAALDADPASPQAWLRLATLLWDAVRRGEALETASDGLALVETPRVRAALALVQGRALEAQGALAEASQAFALAAECEPRLAEAALSRARLLRARGEWRAAGELLARFADETGADGPGVAQVLLQLGRLRAGPLEDVEGAMAAYRGALAAEPALLEAREALAELLTHQPGSWPEAVRRQRELLEERPTRVASLRALLRIAQAQTSPQCAADGLALLRALGAATPAERERAPARLELRCARQPVLGNVVWERARRLGQEASQEIAEALGASTAAPGAADDTDPVAAFRRAAVAAEGELCCPALVPLPVSELSSVLSLVAALTLAPEHVAGDGRLVNALSATVGRWTRRKLRRVVEGMRVEEIAEIDFAGWRAELRGLAHAAALDAIGGDLRAALVALVSEGDDARRGALGDTEDITALVAGCSEARELLRRAVSAWADSLGGGVGE